jgi:hypothetical protein
MKPLFKCLAGLLVLTVIGLYSPKVSFGAGSGLFAQADQKPITQHEPKVMSEPEMDIPVAAAEPGEKKKTNWLLLGGVAVLLIGLAALAGGGGGGDGGGNDNGNGDDTGDITVQW